MGFGGSDPPSLLLRCFEQGGRAFPESALAFHGRLCSAIHGSTNFWKGSPALFSYALCSSRGCAGIYVEGCRKHGENLGGQASQKCAEPWMAEQKRHMDVPKERFLGGLPAKV